MCKNDLKAPELDFLFPILKSVNNFSDAANKWAEWALAQPEFSSSINHLP